MAGKRIISKYFFIVTMFLSFYACEYKTDKIYDLQTDKDVEPPVITTLELSLDDDTVYSYSDQDIYFQFSSSNQEIKLVTLLIDGQECGWSLSDNGIFTVYHSSFSVGAHVLKIEVYTDYGSGSIADCLEVENFLFSNTWTLMVVNYNSSDVKINAGVSGGLLELSWTPYLGFDFREYVIYREVSGLRKEIGRTAMPVIIDDTYVGEAGRIIVEVIKENNSIESWGELNMQSDLPKLYLKTLAPGNYFIAWDKSKYFNATDTFRLSLEISCPPYYVSDFNLVKITSDPDDTTYNLTEALFSDGVRFILEVVPKNKALYRKKNPYYQRYSEGTVGVPYYVSESPFDDLTQVSEDEFIFYESCYYLIRYSVTQQRVMERFMHPREGNCTGCRFSNRESSASGGYLTAYVNCNYDVALINSGNIVADIKTQNLKFLSGESYVPDIPVSDTKLGLVNTSNKGFYIYDFNTSSSLAYYAGNNGSCDGLKISTTGKYIFLIDDSLRLVRFEDSQFTGIWSHSATVKVPKYYEFDAVNPEQLVMWDGAKLSVKLCSDFSTVSEFALSCESIQHIDFFAGRILTYSLGHLYVLSLTDGSLLYDIPIRFNPTHGYNKCILLQNAIIKASGVATYLY